ncbi:phosphate regulon sensor histidine kinase PhoR [Chitinimonas sp. BJB300]|uniref:phosphate regulon sensor histidine kinase PhoR n=1 Tax=Chitinimonas sp. BJB300 TaxID=1559339 RepID=UPI000C11FA9C|nr:phosphate regulon sensor histidine kinase PhoR [Chitinimonas sp. BJB300]PHV12184.1 PAS domain-containing sensor histidine kinase [Chitinimonas sp. BJB300]TSJ91589.1 phosphate regulon sensor histidine kinase PhoR [Chitinimonas sp. BJB300]
MLLWRSALLLAGISLMGLLFQPFFGWSTTLLVIIAGLVGMLAYHLYNLHRLNRWLNDPTPQSIPETMGSWDAVYSKLYRMVRAQGKNQRMLSAALDRFVAAGEAMPEGVVVMDEEDRIEWCNPRSMQHLGLDRKKDLGQHIAYLVRQPAFQQYLLNQDYSQPVVLRHVAGNDFVLSLQLVPFDSTRKLLLTRDITQLERIQTVHRDFVANVSHELRTPLTVVGGFLETLLDMPELDAATREAQLKLMFEQTQRMQRLVEDLLTLSRLENGVEGREERVDTPALLQQLASDAEGLSQGRHTVSVMKETDLCVRGNYDELHSAFGNLVSNAVRYTPDGGHITLSWQLEHGYPVFSVTDTGLGVEAQHIPRLTERFYRVDRGRSRTTGGTGLGLAIVKHIAQRHQAKLEVKSEIGAGSCFAIVFPANRLLEMEDAILAK